MLMIRLGGSLKVASLDSLVNKSLYDQKNDFGYEFGESETKINKFFVWCLG